MLDVSRDEARRDRGGEDIEARQLYRAVDSGIPLGGQALLASSQYRPPGCAQSSKFKKCRDKQVQP